ncbi:MAG TPA: 4'-phosphopantetheinyl transferase superfamily protein [Pyrinomonadaceae bacterium]|nr:4'-phosphopantetheinyl transferase superfamily protein [Pyrinomonadaceae bacterium]
MKDETLALACAVSMRRPGDRKPPRRARSASCPALTFSTTVRSIALVRYALAGFVAAGDFSYSGTLFRQVRMTQTWVNPPSDTPLADGEVHLWRASLVQTPDALRRLRSTLAPDESEKAARYHFPRDRDHYVAARGLLRRLLGHYLAQPPQSLRFSYGAYGKPSLADAAGAQDLRFNLSHSHELVIYAFARGRDVGVDIEHMRADLAGDDIAERFFSAREVGMLRALPVAARTRAFFNCWTRKEAYIKARGEGLSHPLDAFDVSLTPGEPAALLGTRGDPRELTRWSLHALDAGEDYAAAVAVQGTGHALRLWQL